METERGKRTLFVKGVSMLKHEQFERLCALAATGQLSPDEQQQLNEHLADCESCRTACEEFAVILKEMPVVDRRSADKAILRQMEESGFRGRFIARARAEGHRFSMEAEMGPGRRTWRFPRMVPRYQWVTAGIMLVVLFGAVGYRAVTRGKGQILVTGLHQQPKVRFESQPDSQQNALEAKLSELLVVSEASQKTISELKADNTVLLGRVDGLEKQLAIEQSEKQEFGQALAHVSDINSQLTNQNEQNTQLLAQARAELEQSRADRAAMEVQVAAERSEVDQLSQQVRLQTVSLEQDRQLLSAGRDITDLMGARNLHIIDVHDADGKGKDRKSFGRVFYTEGKSLIFYAFDLDEKKVANAKYTFEAWGERLGQPATVKSLGMLYADDKEQKRWVLKVDDPRQLAEIDSVFVTLEPHNSGDKPRGQKILYAFLSGQANHP